MLGSCITAALLFVMPELWQYPLVVALLQGASCAIVSHALGCPPWWQGIHMAFFPAIVLALSLDLPPALWLAGFILLLLIFWRTDSSRVPLYLTNSKTAECLATLLPEGPHYVADLGCGDGRLLRMLARHRPDCEFVGIEHAPLTWLWARLMSQSLPNIHIRYGSTWDQHLTPFDLVYAFLSPAPMAQLWSKTSTEMRPGTRLISNSFPVPEVPAEAIIEVGDSRRTQLFVYFIVAADEGKAISDPN